MLDSTLKAYTQCGKDLEILYRERHFMIGKQMPNLSGCDLQKTFEGIDGDLANIRGEIAECKDAISLIKQGNDPEELRRKFGISLVFEYVQRRSNRPVQTWDIRKEVYCQVDQA